MIWSEGLLCGCGAGPKALFTSAVLAPRARVDTQARANRNHHSLHWPLWGHRRASACHDLSCPMNESSLPILTCTHMKLSRSSAIKLVIPEDSYHDIMIYKVCPRSNSCWISHSYFVKCWATLTEVIIKWGEYGFIHHVKHSSEKQCN